MSQQELLNVVIATLQSLGIEFMLSGSHASSLQGEARSTHDIDLVASLTATDVQPLIDAFRGARFYLSEAAVAEAIRSKRMFNLQEVTTGEKVDFWVLTNSPFDQSRFARRQRIEVSARRSRYRQRLGERRQPIIACSGKQHRTAHSQSLATSAT